MSTVNISVQNSVTQSCWDDDVLSNSESLSEGLFTTLLHATAVNGNKSLLQKLLQEVAGRNDEINRGDQFGRTPLVYSVLGDRLDCAELLIKYGASVCMSDVDGRTPLHWAAYQGNHKCVKLLLSKGADWKAKDTKGRTPLHFAASPHSAKCLSVLLKKAPKGEVDDPDNDSMTALHWGASYGNNEHVKMLLKAKASVKLLDVEKKTPLHWGVTNSNPGVVKLVLEQSNEIINWQDIEGRTALHHAVAQQNEAVVKTLLSVDKCNVSLQDNMYRTPLHWAAVLGNFRIAKLLLRKNAVHSLPDGNGATALHYAAQGNYVKTVDVFLSFRGVKDGADNEGRTALMWAARKGASMALETMLRHHLDAHATDNSGRTALHVAAYSGDIKCVEILLNYGAGVDALDEINHTPLFRACEMGYFDVVNVLMKNNATLDLEDQDGRSPLHWAALNGHAHICFTLIQNGVPANKKDRLGCTPLHCAAYGGFVNCMSVLIDDGADVNKLDHEGISPLHWSCSSGHLEAVKLLLRNRAFPNFMKKDAERLTPLDFAIFGDHQDVAQYMIEQGGLTITAIQDVAATTIQSCWRGYRIRKPFQTRKDLYMRHEHLKRNTTKRRPSCAVREEEIPDRISLINNPGFLKPDMTKNELQQQQQQLQQLQQYQQQQLLDSQDSFPNHEDELHHRNSMDLVFEDDSYYLTSLASQRYSFSEYQGVTEDTNQLSTILESSHPHYSSEMNEMNVLKTHEKSNENVDGVCENSDTKSLDEKRISDESPGSGEEYDQPVECHKNESNSDLEVDISNIMEDEKDVVDGTVQSLSIDHRSSSNTEKKEQTCTKYKRNLNPKPIDLRVIPKIQSYKSPEIVNSHDIAGGAKLSNLQSKSELARKERERRNLIRVKMEAASVIQRWFKRCRDRKRRKHPETSMGLEEVQNDQKELVQQLAALTIQLGWRKYLRQKYNGPNTELRERPLNKVVHSDSLRLNDSTRERALNKVVHSDSLRSNDSTRERSNDSTRERPLNKVVHSDSLRSNDSANTNMSIRQSKNRNKKSEVRRPTSVAPSSRRSRMDSKVQFTYGAARRLRKTALFSPNAASYNLALDMQNPIVAERGDTRTSTPRRGANNKIRPSTSRRATSAWTPVEGIQGRKSQR